MIKVTVLGCGASAGVPCMGCDCAVCTSANPKNRRTRVSILVESATTRILVDTPPDMREQCLQHNIREIDAIMYTHAHADHLHGIDDVRAFNHAKDAPLDVYSDRETLEQIKSRFGYTFLPPKPAQTGWYRPCLNPITIAPPDVCSIGDITIQTFWQIHGQSQTIGLIFNAGGGKIAYSTDTNGLPAESLGMLAGVDIWIVDSMRYEPAPTHAHLALTLDWIKQVKPGLAYLTHMNHDFDYDTLAAELPDNVFPAYDGMTVTV